MAKYQQNVIFCLKSSMELFKA